MPPLILVNDIKYKFNTENTIITSPDVGGVVRARYIANKLDVNLAIVDKRREKANTSEVVNIIGNVKGKDCILIDDIVDTAGTLTNAAEALIDSGANSVSAYVTHGVLSEPAMTRITNLKLKELVTTNTIKQIPNEKNSKIRRLSVAPLIAEAVKELIITVLYQVCLIKERVMKDIITLNAFNREKIGSNGS